MASYVAIDFETANEQRASPCAIGVVRVEDRQVVDEWSTLINPETYFSPMNVSIHGITKEDVVDAPTFPAVLRRVLASADGVEALVAHSAAFDVQVLTSTAARYGLETEPVTFACTRVFARRWWPGWPSYGLMPVTLQLGVDETLDEVLHHDALWDAQVCAAIAERGLAEAGVSTWEEAAESAQVRLGVANVGDYDGCASIHHGSKIVTTRPDDADLDSEHPLYDVSVCFTGALELYTRRIAAQAVADVGGHFSANVTKKTDLLVVGSQDLDRIGDDGMSTKMRKAVKMAAGGHPIEIIDEADFYQLLSEVTPASQP